MSRRPPLSPPGRAERMADGKRAERSAPAKEGGMLEIAAEAITGAVREMCLESNLRLPPDVT